MKKKIVLIALTAGLSVLSSIPAFAGQWKQDNIGWWWQDDDGSYFQWIWDGEMHIEYILYMLEYL